MTPFSVRELAKSFFEQYKDTGSFTKSQLFEFPGFEQLLFTEIELFITEILALGLIEINANNINIQSPDADNEDAVVYDRSQKDFEPIFKEVVRIDASLTHYINYVRKIQPPQENEERYLIPLAKNGNPAARERLIQMFLKIVIRNALYFHIRFAIPLADAIQDGNTGLTIALDKFKEGGEERFSTYFPWWVRQQILRHAHYPIENKFRLPVHLRDKLISGFENLNNSNKFKTKFDTFEYITEEELQFETEISQSNIQKFAYIFQPLIPEEDIDGYVIRSRPAYSDDSTSELVSGFIHKFRSMWLENALLKLPARSAQVLRLRYGLADGDNHTLEEVGNLLGVTRERARQIEYKAMLELRSERFNLQATLFDM